MDLQLPGLHGIDATREIVAAWPGTAVLVLTMFEDDYRRTKRSPPEPSATCSRARPEPTS